MDIEPILQSLDVGAIMVHFLIYGDSSYFRIRKIRIEYHLPIFRSASPIWMIPLMNSEKKLTINIIINVQKMYALKLKALWAALKTEHPLNWVKCN